MKRIIVACFVFVALTCASLAHADDAKPSKDSLLTAWEQVQKDSSYTVKFEPTKEKDVYDFETTIFPYKGKIKVLNLLIEKKPAHFYEFQEYGDETPEGDYAGIVELELDGIDDKFLRKFSYSYHTWARDNALYYHAETKKWYTPGQWADYKETLKAAKSAATSGAVCGPAKNKEEGPTFLSVLISWFPMLLLIGVWVYFITAMKRAAGKYPNPQIVAAENNTLLKEILEVLKRKS
ncbi:MAG: hypothetical protein EPN97_18210 [Alphaproteobacteria bacterium]|nr:MAG: hypothetical protein EPN97_18210 [Alphaproteobacteria bacterium]